MSAVEHPEVEDVVWAAEAGPFEALGSRFSIRTTDPALATLFDDAFSALSSAGPADRMFAVLTPTIHAAGVVYEDGRVIRSSREPQALAGTIPWRVNQLAVEGAERHVVLHASAAAVEGSAVILPAASGSGKTTLVGALLERGLEYVTDEAVAIRADELLIDAYPKPLSVEEGSHRLFNHVRPRIPAEKARYCRRQWLLPPRAFGAEVCRVSVPTAVVFPQYRPGAVCSLTPMRPARALTRLADATFAGKSPAVTLPVLAQIVARSPSFELEYSDLALACNEVLRVLRQAADRGRGRSNTNVKAAQR